MSPIERHNQTVKQLETLLAKGREAEAKELFFYEYTPAQGIPWWCLSEAILKYRKR
jgi:hypothetical protein